MAKGKVLRCVMGRDAFATFGYGLWPRYTFMPRSHFHGLTPGERWFSASDGDTQSHAPVCASFVHRALDKPLKPGQLALVEVRIRVVKLLEK